MAVRPKSIEDLRPEDLPEPEFAAAPERHRTLAEPTPPPAAEPAPSIWNPDMTKAPRDGRVILLAESLTDADGVRALWYKAMGQGRPWAKPPENWLCPLRRQWIGFVPAGWAEWREAND